MIEDEVYVMLMMMRADKGYTPNEKCSLEEMVACALADDTDACLAACTGNEEGEEEEPAGNGLITVKKVGTTTTQEVPYVATNVKVGSIKLTAGDADTKVSSVEISRDGLGDFDNQNDVFGDGDTNQSTLFVTLRSETVETDTVAVSLSKESARVKFSPAITIKAGKSETFDVVVDTLAGYENATHNFKVTAVNVSNGTATGLPVSLGTIKTTSSTPKTVNVTVEDGDTSTLIAGDTDKLLAKLDVVFDKSAGKLDRFSLEDTVLTTKLGDAFENVYAYVDGKKVGKVYVSDEKIVVSNLGISADKDDEIFVEIRGDVIFEEAAANFIFQLSSIDITNNGYGLVATTAPFIQPNGLTVGGADTSFTKVALTEKEFLPGKTNITVFNGKFKPSINVKINTATVTCSPTLTAASLKSASAQLIVDGEEFDISDANLIAGSANFTNMKIDVDANSEITVKMVLGTKKPTSTTALIDESIQCSVALAGNGIEDTTNTFTSKTVKADKVDIKEGFATVADAIEQGPVTRSLFSNKEQEAGRFSVEAEGDNITLNELVLSYTTTITATDDIEAILNTLTIVDVDSDSELTSDDPVIDTTLKTVTFKNIKNYTINKDKTVDLKAMLNLSDISSFYGKTLQLKVSDITVKSSIRTIDKTINPIATPVAMSDTAYTFRMNAPTITLTKVSENKFKVVIKNSDKDNAVFVDTLRYRVRATADDSTFAGKVCLADDSSVIECDTTDTHVLDAHNFGIRADGLTSEVKINGNQSKTYYIVVDGTSIEPEVLQADISKLSYGDTTGNTDPENYSESAK